MTGDPHGRTAGKATLLVRAMDEILGTYRLIAVDVDAIIVTACSRRSRQLLPGRNVWPVDWTAGVVFAVQGAGCGWHPLRSLIMTGLDDLHRYMASLVVSAAGFFQAAGEPWNPFG
jgi:hypothetical protein